MLAVWSCVDAVAGKVRYAAYCRGNNRCTGCPGLEDHETKRLMDRGQTENIRRVIGINKTRIIMGETWDHRDIAFTPKRDIGL